jgi:hypothetical protein
LCPLTTGEPYACGPIATLRAVERGYGHYYDGSGKNIRHFLSKMMINPDVEKIGLKVLSDVKKEYVSTPCQTSRHRLKGNGFVRVCCRWASH